MARKTPSVAIFGIHPSNFEVDVIFMGGSDAGTSGSFLHEAEYRTDMVELTLVHMHQYADFADRTKATLEQKAAEMRAKAGDKDQAEPRA